MLNRDENENGFKANRSNKKKKKQIARAARFVFSLSRCFARLQRCFVRLKRQTS